MKRKILILLFILTILAIFSIPHISTAEQKTIRIGFVPGKSPHILVSYWHFVINYLNNELGIPFEFVIKENYSDILEAFEKGEIDILEGSTFVQSLLLKKNISVPVIGERRMGRLIYRSAIVVRAKSEIHTLNDLKGKSFSFTDPLSTSGSILPRIMFQENGIDNLNSFFKKIHMSGSQDKAIKMLINKQVDAISVGNIFIEYLEPNVRKTLRIIAQSPAYPLGHISAQKTLPKPILEKIQTALANIHKKIPHETLEYAEIERFEPIAPHLLDQMRELPDKAAKLKPFTYEESPKRIAQIFSQTKKELQESSYTQILISSLILITILAFLTATQTKGSLRKYFSISIFIPISLFVILISFVELALINNTITDTLDSSIHRLDKFELDINNFLSQDTPPSEAKANQLVYEDPLISAIRLFRNSKYVLDSTKLSKDKPILYNILTNQFSLLPSNKSNFVELFETVWHKKKIWGTAQILIDFNPIKNSVSKIIFFHAVILVFIFLLGSILFFTLIRILKKPLHQIANSLQKLKKEEIEISPEETDQLNKKAENLNALAEEFSHLSEDLVEQNTFLELKQKQLSTVEQTQHTHNMDLDLELENKIKKEIVELENKHKDFKQLRQTELIGSSSEFLKTLMDAIIRSKDNDPALIFGPTGSGKTGIAKTIHLLSNRRQKPFGEFNCAEFASADPLVVLGKLFGYGKNSGIQGIPKEGQHGLLEKYNGGTIFFDEAELIPHQAQRLLLLPLEGRPINPAAGTGDAKQVNVRFIFATNIPLTDEISTGLIRADFYRRINARGTITVAPLKHRKKDILPLTNHFMSQWNRANQKNTTFTDHALVHIKSLDFAKYNVSELKTLLTIAADRALFAEEDKIDTKYFPNATPRMNQQRFQITSTPSFDELEEVELSALRQNDFNFFLAEKTLGYSNKSKTLTNHFRGLCYKLLAKQIKNKSTVKTEDFLTIALKLVGNNSLDSVSQKLSNKIQRIYKRTQSVPKAEHRKLLNNLPKKYVQYLQQLLQ